MSTTLDTNKVREILDNTIEVLETDGWTQGATVDDLTGQRCILGCIDKAAKGRRFTLWQRSAAIAALADQISADTGLRNSGVPTIVHFNDDILSGGQQASNSIRKIKALVRKAQRSL